MPARRVLPRPHLPAARRVMHAWRPSAGWASTQHKGESAGRERRRTCARPATLPSADRRCHERRWGVLMELSRSPRPHGRHSRGAMPDVLCQGPRSWQRGVGRGPLATFARPWRTSWWDSTVCTCSWGLWPAPAPFSSNLLLPTWASRHPPWACCTRWAPGRCSHSSHSLGAQQFLACTTVRASGDPPCATAVVFWHHPQRCGGGHV